ncbi:MAG: universal stress protein [Gemmatimonadota bacterium]
MSGEIVLATRFGPSSAAPAAVASRLADRFGAPITVVYVATELDALIVSGGEAGVDLHGERDRILERINDELVQFIAEHLHGRGASMRVVERGDVADGVTRAAEELGAAFLVVGTRGRGQLARLILGDTTQNILQHAPCPVVVVPLRDSDGGGV